MIEIYSEPGLVSVEHDPQARCFVSHWASYHGPHFRRAVEAMLAVVREHGIDAYIADASAARDVPTPADFQWAETHVKAALLSGGIKKFITVVPASAVAKLGATRFGKVASTAGVDTWQVASVTDALDAAIGQRAA